MDAYSIKPIGRINSPHKKPEDTPIQPVFATGIKGSVTIFDEYADGLLDLDGFSHIYLIYLFDRMKQVKLRVHPFLEDKEHGVFATRAPCHPNKIGFSVVRLLGVYGSILQIEDVDILDGTPLLDIKPYVARFDLRKNVRSGWQDNVDDKTASKRGLRGYGKD